MKNKGIVLDGFKSVGTFDLVYKTFNIKYLENLKLKLEYIDIPNQQSNKELFFLYLFEHNKSVFSEKIGYGYIYGSFWISDNDCIFKIATFISRGQDEN